MKPKPTILFLALCAVALTGCGDSHKERVTPKNGHVLFRGHKWDVVNVNDSTVVCLPGLNADSELSPTVINLNDPDCPCREKGGEE